MHWRHIKWRAPWQKRHLSVLEIFRAEEAAREKNTAIRRSRDKATHVCPALLVGVDDFCLANLE
jgi:putative IMPACT (imprinted ancient) family translation regulator